MARGALPRLGRAGGAGGGGARSRRGRVGRRLERRVVVAFVEVDELRQVLGLVRPDEAVLVERRVDLLDGRRHGHDVRVAQPVVSARGRGSRRARAIRPRGRRARSGGARPSRPARRTRTAAGGGGGRLVTAPESNGAERVAATRGRIRRARARVRHHVATTIRVRNRTRRPSVGARRRRGARSSSRRGLAFDKKRVARPAAPASRASAWDPRHVPCPSLHVMIQRRARARTAADKSF